MKFALIVLLLAQLPAEAENTKSRFHGLKLKIQQEARAQGNAPAVELCHEIAPGDSWDALIRSSCLETVSKTKISDAAVELCRQMSPKTSDSFSKDDRLECLEIIAEKELGDSVIIACGQIDPGSPSSFTGDNRLKCLRDAVGNKQDEASVQTETQAPAQTAELTQEESRQAKNEAIAFCRHEIVNHYKEDCLQIVAPSRFVDKDALQLCKNQPSHNQIDCLLAIVNKEYVSGLIEECSERNLHQQIDCLLEYGSPIGDETNTSEIVIVIQSGSDTQSFPSECKYENTYGVYPEGGGCNFHGCWVAGGGCNFHGCWYPGGHCNMMDGCVNQAPEIGICQ